MATKKDLILTAKDLGVVGYGRMNKKTLEQKIEEAESGLKAGLAIVQEVVSTAQKDVFPTGAVIRWQAGIYTYAALKAGNGSWYTTAASFNSFVPQIVSFEDLMEIITRSEVEEVAIATEWETLD